MTLRELVADARAALVVVDIQNDFCDPDGATARSGKSVDAMLEIVPRIEGLIDGARASSVPVIFVQMLQTPWTQTKTYMFRGGDEERPAKCVAGTWGAEFYRIAPRDGEAVVVKHRYSAFVN